MFNEVVRPRFVPCEVCVALKFGWFPDYHLDNLRIRYMQKETESTILSCALIVMNHL